MSFALQRTSHRMIWQNFYCPTLIVAPLTARRGKKPHQPTHYLLSSVKGMDGASVVLLEQIKTIDKRRVVRISGVSAANRWMASTKPYKSASASISPKKWRHRNEVRAAGYPGFIHSFIQS